MIHKCGGLVMFDYQLIKVERIIRHLYHRDFFSGKNIYLFGVGENTRQVIMILRKVQLEPVFVLDNDKIKQGTYCSGIPVISVENVKNLTNPFNLYIICLPYWREMMAQFRTHGVKKKNILILYREESLFSCFYHAMLGKQIYDHLIAVYGKIPLFVCPYTGTGDIYLIGTFWNQYTKINQINDYVFLVLNKACEKVARLFNVKNLVVFNQSVDCSYLIRYYMLCPKVVKLTLLNDSWQQIHTNYLAGLRGYKGLNFTVQFRKFVFNLPDEAQPEHPIFRNADKEVLELLERYSLEEGKTVIVSPYSNTLAGLPDEFWKKLVRRLKQFGFSVCTNSSGDREPAIEGTASVFFSLDIAPQMVEKAGYFIGIRSGFCDIISGTKAKKVILYQAKERFFNSSSYEYFSLKKMGLSSDAIEIQFDSSDNQLCEEIINFIDVK